MAIRRNTDAPNLKAETIAVLLAGWGAPDPPEPSEPGFGGGFIDLLDADGPATLWHQHEAWLRARAEAWGWAPQEIGPDGVRRFWAEHLAGGFKEP